MGKAIEVILSSKVVGSIIIVLISIVVFLIIKESTLKYIAKKRRRADRISTKWKWRSNGGSFRTL